MKMKTFLTTAFALMVVCASAVEVSVTKKSKRSIGNNEDVVTGVVIRDLNFVDTNSYEHASTARVKFPGTKSVIIQPMNPAYSGSEISNPSNNIKGTFLMQLDEDAETNSKFDFSEIPEGKVKVIGPGGKEYSADLILRAKTIDLKMNRRMPKMKQSDVDTLPEEAVTLDASSTEFTVGKLVTEYNKLASGFNLLRSFVMSNAIADVNAVSIETVATSNIVNEIDTSFVAIDNYNTATITLDPGEGSFDAGVSSTFKRTIGSAIGDLPTPTRSGYIFVRWEVNILGTVVTSSTKVDGDLELVAAWGTPMF